MACETIVFRVQDSDGRGPFKPGFSHRWAQLREDHDFLFPWLIEFPNVIELAKPGMHLGCGCLTLEQLRRWFIPSEYETLLGFGYRAVQLQVGRILARSLTQCVFERATPLRLGIKAIELYCKEPTP